MHFYDILQIKRIQTQFKSNIAFKTEQQFRIVEQFHIPMKIERVLPELESFFPDE